VGTRASSSNRENKTSAAKEAAEKISSGDDSVLRARVFRLACPPFRSFTVGGAAFFGGNHTTPPAYTAGISLAMRIRLPAVATSRNNQSTFLFPRTFTWRAMLSSLAHPNTFSTNLRFR